MAKTKKVYFNIDREYLVHNKLRNGKLLYIEQSDIAPDTHLLVLHFMSLNTLNCDSQ